MQKKKIEIDDFIAQDSAENLRTCPKGKIDLEAKLMNFSNIKVSAIDPKIKRQLSDLLRNIKSNMAKIKATYK